MQLNNFTNMNRQGSDLNIMTRFLMNGRIVGPPGRNRIVKLPGYANSVTSKSIQGGGYVQFNEATRFKHPNHDFAITDPTHFLYDPGKETGTLYYWNSTLSLWIEITNNGNRAFAAQTHDQVRYWKNRGVLHINGFKGRPFVYLYIDRQIGNEEGYFRDSIEQNGFYLVDEELPQFNLNLVAQSDGGYKLQQFFHLQDNLDKDKSHTMMGIYICEGGQESIYEPDSFLHRMATGQQQTGFYVEIYVDPDTLDRRVTDIDFYVADRKINQVVPGILSEIEEEDQYLMDWRFLKRVSINKDTVWMETKGYDGEAQSQNQIDIDISESPDFDFGANTFSNKFWLACKSLTDTDWILMPITSTVNRTPDETHCRINLSNNLLTTGLLYKCRFLSRWSLDAGGDYKTSILLFEDAQFGDPYDVAQPYSIYKEYYPYANFATVQNRRAFRLDVFWNGKRKKNWLMWSEPDRTEVLPLKNKIVLNTYSGENAMGLVSIANGLLPLFERTVHYVRMTAEPVRYDGEENRFEDGCISTNGIIDNGSTASWAGVDGLKMFDGRRVINLLKDTFKDDYIKIIASEYSNNSNSYEGIVGAFCSKHNLMVWTFPNSTYQIEGQTIRLIAYDMDNPGVLFLGSDKNLIWLYEDYDGTLFGLDANGIYELFSESPTESNQLTWISGWFSTEKIAERTIEKFRFRYNGGMTLSVYVDDLSTEVGANVLKTKTSIGNYTHPLAVNGELFKIKMASASATSDAEIVEIMVEGREVDK